jgi:nitrile hydratase
MDGVHDLGGREGFGPVHWQSADDSKFFHEEWQARTWAMAMCMLGAWRRGDSGVTLDWFRHVRERIDPIDYLTRNYFDQWAQTIMAVLIDDGTVELEELTGTRPSGNPKFLAQPAPAQAGGKGGSESAPGFKAGDRVRTRALIGAAHTRLPGYARGRIGVIEEHHGAEIFADASARGEIRNEHLYTIAFDASELWPEAKDRRDRIYIDAWESYLEPA